MLNIIHRGKMYFIIPNSCHLMGENLSLDVLFECKRMSITYALNNLKCKL